jgi:4a-hydroxytetrahydrobiopterin dehydratase
MTTLAEQKCIPCQGGVEPLRGEDLRQRTSQLGQGWDVVEGKSIEKTWSFDNFAETWGFVSQVAELAREQDHHPDVYFTYGKATITLWTHKIDGLHDNDFIMAAKIDRIQPIRH